MTMYAYTDTSFRSVASESDAVPGERIALEVPAATLLAIRAAEVRKDIRTRIADTNWALFPDAQINATDKAAVMAYRAALRALPDHPDFPESPWPTPPNTTGVGSETGEQS